MSGRRHRVWGAARMLLVPLALAGSLLVPWLVQGTPLDDLWGLPYPPMFARKQMILLDYYALGLVGLGLVFLEGAMVALRASKFPRTDGTGAALLGTVLCALGGLGLFVRLWLVLHA